MIERRDTLDEALTDTAAGALAGAASVDAMNGHYVEIGDAAGPPLFSERPA